jgi:hypothetical protein
VATTEFRDAAVVQARSLGFEPAVVWVEHPIQNRTAAELEALADTAIEPILDALTSGGGGEGDDTSS